MVIDKVWFSKEAPSSDKMLWLRPSEGNGNDDFSGLSFYIFNNGGWEPLSLGMSFDGIAAGEKDDIVLSGETIYDVTGELYSKVNGIKALGSDGATAAFREAMEL